MEILIGAGIGAVIGGIYKYFKSSCTCVYAHEFDGLNYVWLEPHYGKVLKVEFEEPANSGKWRDYDKHWWEIHCKVIDHKENLINAHMKAFVNPETRFARLRFTFNKNSQIYQMEPDINFYKLEKEYFHKYGICS